MSGTERARILLVDDEPRVLDALRRNLRGSFQVSTATSSAEALEILVHDGPFAVLVSDLRMPVMDGVTLLMWARESAPDTTRVLLTGHVDLENAIAAVNDGAVFRFLTKPCAPDLLLTTLQAAVEQNRLVTAERVLLEQTLRGSVKALTDILALVSPLAFGRGMRARTAVNELMDCCAISGRWPIEVAAMLSQIGCVALPPQALEKVYHGEALLDHEQAMVTRLPTLVEELLANIPRLEPVREILRYQNKNYDGTGLPYDSVRGESIPWGARALRVVLDLDVLETRGMPPALALDTMRGREGWYDPAILAALARARGGAEKESKSVVRELLIRDLRTGMLFAEDVRTVKGLLLIARGYEVTVSLTERIRNFSAEVGVREPIRVIIRDPGAQGSGQLTSKQP
jgi:response regulator RpfG family c-di-GMP phosphodiesterase